MVRVSAIVLSLVLLSAACGGDSPSPTPPVDEASIPLGVEASTKLFAVNPDPNPPRGIAVLADLRVATHTENGGFDRIVFEFKDSLPGAEIEYVDQATYCGSGQRVPAPSSAVLLIRFASAQAHDDAGKATTRNRVGLFGPALLQAMQTCDFEGELTWALAVNGKKPFAVTTLKGPSRLVIDIPARP